MPNSPTTNTLGPGAPPRGELRFKREILIHAQQLLQTIDDAEDERERYHTLDLPQFNVWLERYFPLERTQVANLERELAAAVQMHNWTIAVSKQQGLSLEQAYVAMKQEQAEYLAGNEARRRKIEEERAERERFVREDLDREFQARMGQVGLETDQAPGSMKQHSSSHTGGDTGSESFLEDSGDLLASPDAERLKMVYRRLVRRLHPDMQGPQMDATERRWQKKIWHLSQLARQRADVDELNALYKVSLLRQMELSELTIADAHEVHAWLRNEMDRIDGEINELRAHPAWGFSVSGATPALIRRLELDYEQEIAFLAAELREIRTQQSCLEALSGFPAPAQPELKRRRTRPRPPRDGDGQLSLFDETK